MVRNNKKEYFFIFLLVVLLMTPNLLLILIGQDSVIATPIKKVGYLLFTLSFLIVPLSFIKPKSYFRLGLIVLVPACFEIFYIILSKSPSSQGVLAATLFYSNKNEATEFLSKYYIYLLFFFPFIGSYIVLLKKISPETRLHSKLRWRIGIFSFIILGGIFSRDLKTSFALDKNDLTSMKIYGAISFYEVKLYKTFPLGIFFKLLDIREGQDKVNNYNKNIEHFSFHSSKRDTIKGKETYVLVLGETARFSNFNINGYKRNTTPCSSKDPNILSFKNVMTGANLTSLSVPMLVTRDSPLNNTLKYTEASILKAFEEAGFKTFWLSNQGSFGSLYKIYEKQASFHKDISKSIDAINYDELLLPELKTVLGDTASKKFIVLHTMGSHYRYSYRYPKSFREFKPDLDGSLSIAENNASYKKLYVNSYDNTILYTDFILNAISLKLKKTKGLSFMYYISDHGENLYDDSNNFFGHGFTNPTQYELHVPLIIWTSEKYRVTYPLKLECLNKNIDAKISSYNTFQTLLDLANIYYPKESLKQSFANPKFDTLQSRYFLKTDDKTVIKLD